ncbi:MULTISPECIES: SDR family oxidoreductase [unclassified Frankia]|uniref:SDR family oxidoreductase n=1 Tax=unclassified Frankia TaxID=2632575 RepID=UPI001EF617B0|nr:MULTISPECIES: SDR family NAD(P)-dependent oxidoreductase [unclassified Frankia]
MTAKRQPELVGRTALVTGASSGIGRAIAVRLAVAGASVVATGRNRRALDELAAAADRREVEIHLHPADITDTDARAELAAAVRQLPGGLSIMIHSAGAYQRSPVAEADISDLDHQYAVNVRAPYALTQLLLPELLDAGRRSGGDIIFVNSTQGITASPNISQYAATKHALRAIADSLRAEVADAGVRVCTMLPGRTATPMQRQVVQAGGPSWAPDTLMAPRDVAEMVTAVLALPIRTTVTEVVMRPARMLPG